MCVRDGDRTIFIWQTLTKIQIKILKIYKSKNVEFFFIDNARRRKVIAKVTKYAVTTVNPNNESKSINPHEIF